ncbi:NAD(P)-dependent oxidoreductase [Mycobacterium sp. KBS0706]|uniref:NAD(P)-dependent oxidoreductase n=1 Tax=Mycobacterium sp. KBS0706 TaxID=2578109 RepID=UPI00110FA490|nr:NAD(P)-binding domain-containing protein [Mycobacterium sp. KBS0706]TSD83489.1 NAD(P)-dependent oxidoreductase [Mycobacterium sp. KBS0706]
MKIGFSGLGQMGKPIALNLLGGGGDLVVHDIRADAFPEFEAKGARTTTAPALLAAADVVFLCLPSAPVVRALLLGEHGLAEHLGPGRIVVDLSTITYTATTEIANALEARGVAFLDAPVSGMEARARDGTLTVMCGGRRDVFDAVKPYLHRIGTKVLYMGASGSGQLTKLINQLLFDINAAALAEILPMAVKMGLDPENVAEVVNSGTGRSYASEFFVPRILEGSFSAGYPMKAAYKDLISAAEISAGRGIPLPVLAAATATYQQALLKGHGDEDKGGMIHVFEDLLGVRFRKVSSQA